MAKNDSGITRGYTVSYRAERQNEHRELTAMSELAAAADRSAACTSPCNRVDVSRLTDSLGRHAVRRSFASDLQRSH
jgi:hypothetical protein